MRDGDRLVFIDWDGAGPGSALWDLAYAAKGFTPLVPGGDPAVDAARLAAPVDGYGLAEADRRRLPRLVVDHTRGMHRLLVDGHRDGIAPWDRFYAEGHADHWGPAADYIEDHADHWRCALGGRPGDDPRLPGRAFARTGAHGIAVAAEWAR